MVRKKQWLYGAVILGFVFVLIADLFLLRERQGGLTHTMVDRLVLVQTSSLSSNSPQRIYQNGKVELGAAPTIWWSPDSEVLYIRAFQTVWEYCPPCRVLVEQHSRHPFERVSPTKPSDEIQYEGFIQLDLDSISLVPGNKESDQKASLIDKWDRAVVYQAADGAWRLAGYSAEESMLVEWVNFHQVSGLENHQPVRVRLSPDGRWVAFAAGTDANSFDSVWLLALDPDQTK